MKSLPETFRLLGILLLGLLVGDLTSALLPHSDTWASTRLLGSLVVAWGVVAAIQHRRDAAFLPGPLWTGPTRLAGGLLLGTGLTLMGLIAVSHLPFPPPESLQAFHGRLNAGPTFPLMISMLLIAPVCEEIFFRGWMLSAWRSHHAGWVAVVASAIPFTLVHFFSWQMLIALPLGLLFGWIALQQRSLLPAMAAHLGANLTPLLMEPLLGLWGHSREEIEAISALPWSLAFFAVLLFVIGAALLVNGRQSAGT